jgi:glyoxylase-like metal-dependent hydrolase (beta-lactamase superfamily II)
LILTHSHFDHFGAQIPLLEESTPDVFVSSFSFRMNRLYNDLLNNAVSKGIRCDTIRHPTTRELTLVIQKRFIYPESNAILFNIETPLV